MSSEIAEPRYRGDRIIEVPCDCAGSCSIMLVSEWDGDEEFPEHTSIDFYVQHREDTWRQRLKAAWASLRGKGGYYHGIVTTPEQAEQLGAWLLNRLVSSPPTRQERARVVDGLQRDVEQL